MRAANPEGPWAGERTPPTEDLDRWMAASTDLLVAALADAPDGAPCWTWWGEPTTAEAVGRHQVQEAAVHRWDAALAVGSPAPLAAEIADDGVGEFLEIMVGPDAAATLNGEVVLESTDTGGTWRAGRPGESSALVRGSASDLVLFLYGRPPARAVETEGDGELIVALRAAADMA